MHRIQVAEGTATDSFVEAFNPTDPTHPSNIGPSHDEYYPTIAFNALLVVFTDPSLSDHHTAVVDAIMYIFRSLRLKVVTFLPQVRTTVRAETARVFIMLMLWFCFRCFLPSSM